MATKVFISWSGELSNKLAEALRHWLPGVLQFVKPYFTPSDIEKGTKWGSEILSELGDSDIGIICLTKENLEKPWILFEAGALSKNFEKSRVCTLLFGIETTDLKGPLTIFQTTKFEKSDFKKLVNIINSSGGDSKLEDTVLDSVFKMWWGKLEQDVQSIMENHREGETSGHRTERDILEEVLELSRLNSKRHHREREYEVSPKAIHDIVRGFSELNFAAKIGDIKMVEKLITHIDEPIQYLCKTSGVPRLYEDYMMMRKRHHRFIEDNEDGVES